MAALSASRGFGSDPLWQRAQAYLVRGQLGAARQVLTAFQCAGRGSGVHAYLLAAQLALFDDRVRDAARLALGAAQVASDDVEARCAVAGLLLETGETVAARDCLDRVSPADCRDALPLVHASALRKQLHQHVEALALLDRAKSLGDTSPMLRVMRGASLIANGRLNEAEAEFAAALTVAPAGGRVAVQLVRLRRQTPERNYLAEIGRAARLARPGSEDAAALEFSRYKTLEDLGRFDEAWQVLTRANALVRARLPNTFETYRAALKRLVSVGVPVNRAAPGKPAGPAPIFIVGMPRSGTTLLERMLGNHSQVALAGELTDFSAQLRWVADTRNLQTDAAMAHVGGLDHAELGRRYLAQTQWYARGRRFYIDKQPTNWLLATAIRAALPDAPILHMLRDPMDTCFSNWRTYFGSAWAYSYDMDTLVAYYNDYRRAMAQWHALMPGAIFDVRYSDLVNDPDATLRKVFAFCGLEWESGCSDITRNAAPSGTVSAVQVRRPLRRDTGGQWRRYADQLAAVADALAMGNAEPA